MVTKKLDYFKSKFGDTILNSKDGGVICGRDSLNPLSWTKYVELNPVREVLAKSPQDWPCGSAGHHIKGEDDALVKIQPLLDMIQNPWEIIIGDDVQRDEYALWI